MRDFGTAHYGYHVRVPGSARITEGDPIIVVVLNDSGTEVAKLSFKGKVTANFFQSGTDQQIAAEKSNVGAYEALKIVADGALPARKALKSLSQLVPFGQQVSQRPKLAELLRDAGRAMVKADDINGALRLLNASRFLNPDDNETIFQLSLIHI